MFFRQLFAKKSLATLLAEAEGENRLRRVLGPVGLTSLGIGAIIGAGIFVMTGRVAAVDAGPAIVVSYVVAGVGCALAALCYAEFASMAPVAGSAYTYAYATLGELVAWMIGWDLVLEYAMSAATVGASWSKYFNEFLQVVFGWQVPDYLCHDPFSHPGAWANLPAVGILALITVILVIGIRESAASNTALVIVKTGVVFFVIAVGAGYVSRSNWFDIPAEQRVLPEQAAINRAAADVAGAEDRLLSASRDLGGLFGKSARTVVVTIEEENKKDLQESYKVPDKSDLDRRADVLRTQALVLYLREQTTKIAAKLRADGTATPEQITALEARAEVYVKRLLDRLDKEHQAKDITGDDLRRAEMVIAVAKKKAADYSAEKWGLLGTLGMNQYLTAIDDSVRSNYFPYGLSGVMLGAALVFFAFIGFDSISTHSEEAIRPQRDVPFGIIASLIVCTVLYIAVSLVITGMQPYPFIDRDAAVASAFRLRAEETNSSLLHASAGLIAAGGLAGMTSVILITLLSQARIFLAMARDHLLPPAIFGVVHEKYRTPHISTMLTGGIITVVAAFTPIEALEEMVNIGTLFAFIVVCAAVLLLRIQNPTAERPFRCPIIWVVAPLGILVNLTMMLFLTVDSWLRLVIWMGLGFVIYFAYGMWVSTVGKQLRGVEVKS